MGGMEPENGFQNCMSMSNKVGPLLGYLKQGGRGKKEGWKSPNNYEKKIFKIAVFC